MFISWKPGPLLQHCRTLGPGVPIGTPPATTPRPAPHPHPYLILGLDKQHSMLQGIGIGCDCHAKSVTHGSIDLGNKSTDVYLEPSCLAESFDLHRPSLTSFYTDHRIRDRIKDPNAMDRVDSTKPPGNTMVDVESKPGVVQPTKQDDVAAAYTNYFNEHEPFSQKEAKSLRWKLDRRLIPLLMFNIILGAMDKVSTSTGALYGMREDTNSEGDRYSWLGSSFYFGYLVWCFPAASLLQKFPIAKLMSCVIFRKYQRG